MKIFSKISISTTFLTISLGTYGAAPTPPQPQREKWQLRAEAFLQGLHPKLGKDSPVMILGIHPATWIAQMVKSGGYIINKTNLTVTKFSINNYKIVGKGLATKCLGGELSMIPSDGNFTFGHSKTVISPHDIVEIDLEKITEVLKSQMPEKYRSDALEMRFWLSDIYYDNMCVDNVILHTNSTITIQEKRNEPSYDRFKLIVTGFGSEPTTYKIYHGGLSKPFLAEVENCPVIRIHDPE